ncbi:MAG: HDOD domain-containing protein [Gammaproteobacteria bacterium]|nr:HDOD domain-containing protein [Gammaproteobacteria bacterium]
MIGKDNNQQKKSGSSTSNHQSDMFDRIFYSRNPIYYTADLSTFAYSLKSSVPKSLSTEFISELEYLLTAISDLKQEIVFDKAKAWMEVTSKKFDKSLDINLERRKLIIKLPSDLEMNADTVAALNRYTKKGTQIAIDHEILMQKMHPLALSANIACFDLRGKKTSEITENFYRIKNESLQYAAFNVNHWEQLELVKKLGFQYFSGTLFYKPKPKQNDETTEGKFAVLQLLARLQSPNVQIEDVNKIIAKDKSISEKLLSYINNPVFNLRSKVSSVQQALVLLGLNALRRWLLVAVLTEISPDSIELMRMALIRAKMCEQLGETQQKVNTDNNFLIGLFSSLDMLVGRPIEEIVVKLKLEKAIADSILKFRGAGGIALYGAKAYERGSFDKLSKLPYSTEELTHAYKESLKWAQVALASFVR